MENTFKKLYDFIFSVIKYRKYGKLKSNTIGDIMNLHSLYDQYLFLIRYENDHFSKVEQELKDAFEKGIVLNKTYHEGTLEYERILTKYPKIRKLNNCESIEFEVDNNDLDKEIKKFYYEDRVLYDYTIIELIEKCERYPKIGTLDYKSYNILKKAPFLKMTDNGLFVEKDVYSTVFSMGEPQDIYIQQRNGEVNILSANKIHKTNYFKNQMYKIFDKNGEIKDLTNINYANLTKEIRNAVAHNNIETYVLENGQMITAVKLENKILLLENTWFFEFLTTNLSYKKSTFNYIYISNYNKIAITENEIDDVLEKSYLIKITLDEYGAENIAFESFIDEKIKKYASNLEIKQSITEYLKKHISKYYENFKIELKPLLNKEGIKKRLLTDLQSFKDTNYLNKELISFQRVYIMNILNNFYSNFKTLNNPDDVICDNAGIVFGVLFNQYTAAAHGSKINIDFGTSLEKMFSLCQFTIFFRLIKNSLFDNLKNIQSNFIYDTKNLKNENSELINNIQSLDMSKIEIIDSKTKQIHNVESFGDKLFSLRLIRNSLSHNALSYKLQKLNNIEDLQLNFKSLENSNLTLKVKAGDLLDILSNEFFKNHEKLNLEEKIYTIKDFENLIKNLCK